MAVMRRSMPVSGAVLIRGGAPASSAPITTRSARTTLGTTFGYPLGPTGPSTLGFTTNGNAVNGNVGGGAPSWMCALIGRVSCSYSELIAAGLDYLVKPGGGGSPGGTNLVANCPDGTIPGPAGTCLDLFPGGSMSGAGMVVTEGEAVIGAFNLPARVPAIVGELANGTPIRRCPRRHVLGLDNLCYVKGTITRQFRKWVPTAKAPVTAYDAKMMRRYGAGGSKAKAAKKLAQEAGYSCKK